MAVKKVHENKLPIPAKISGIDAFEKAFAGVLDAVTENPQIAAEANIGFEGNPVTTESVISADKWVERQIQGAQNAAARWEEGIQRPSRSFKQAALDAGKKWEQRTQDAIADHRFNKGMAGVNEDQAIQTALAVGGSGYASGVANRKAKITAKIDKMQPMVVALKQTLDKMPSATTGEAEAKAIAAIRGMRDIGARLRSS